MAMKKFEIYDFNFDVEVHVCANTEENTVQFIFDVEGKKQLQFEIPFDQSMEIRKKLALAIDKIKNEISNYR